MSISWLRLNGLSTVIPQTIIDNLLAGTVLLENHLQQLVQQKYKKNIGGDFNYFYRFLYTHACLKASLTYQSHVSAHANYQISIVT